MALLLSTTLACSNGTDLHPGPLSTQLEQKTDILVPASGALLGHYYGTGTIEGTDARIGRKPAIQLTYYAWSDDWVPQTRAQLADGRIPMVNWEPFDVEFDNIISGKHDKTIEARADGAKALGSKFFLDFAAEMNEGEGWGGHVPSKYIAAYRHIHDIFVSRGATNVVWAWCPNNTDSASAPTAMDYYPGDEYVDWTGVDGYNWGTSDDDFRWQSFREVFADIYADLAEKGKPIIIGEMASDEVGGDKAQWITEIVPTLKNVFPLVKAVVWFDVDKERHWQINSSPSSLTAYTAMATDPYFSG
ncbi:glycoside hydrolase family 26 protein [Amycolatopsis lurida]|uniref:glycoside hydrolase family 26 protein n=1 Tax=Amycolatopsis lurida TaxID=31959 RepID=UPI001F525C5B|nr:glycosyl hydrolase [Amycolatopsis lurida]